MRGGSSPLLSAALTALRSARMVARTVALPALLWRPALHCRQEQNF